MNIVAWLTGPVAPLTTLLSWVWIAHTIEIDNTVEAVGSERFGRRFRISLPMWTNGLRFIEADGITVDALRGRARAACNLGGLERWGWISVGNPSIERRAGYGSHRGIKGDTILHPTRAGAYARRLWPQIVARVEERWRERFGGDVIDGLRAALEASATPMPWSPPEVYPSDGFRTHIVDSDNADGERPLAALLGQVLTGLTLKHERQAEISLPLGAAVVRVIGGDEVRIRDLPALSGVSKESIAMATGFLHRRSLATVTSERRISLTAGGLAVLQDYQRRAARQRQTDLRKALTAVVEQRDALSAGLVPPDGCWREERPYLTQTKRLLTDPTGALPWHPMVLHRGGWPDGS